MAKLLARVRLCLVGLVACLPAACNSEGHFTFLGYTTQPTYDPGIRTVYVPIFQNITYARGVEFDLTRAIIREIESKTPFKVVDSAVLRGYGADRQNRHAAQGRHYAQPAWRGTRRGTQHGRRACLA